MSSGGDRGRDFESFTTRLALLEFPENSFAARSSGDRKLVFACSLQKTIETKIRKDVRTLVDQGGVDEIVYFCEPNLPIAKRLKLIDEAKAQGVGLQIFDGNAIAEWLAEPDIFWIAQEYLHLPSELVPAGELEEGYIEHRQKWQARVPIPINRADFLAIKAGLRKATFDDSARADLRFWLDKMAAFLPHPAPRGLARDAMYEIAVANLRGKGDLTPTADLVADYFSDVSQHTSIGEITDAVVLLTYCFGGLGLGQYDIDAAELFARRRKLVDLFEQWLAQTGIGPGRRSGLLRMRGSLEFAPAEPGLVPDVARAFEFWNEMLDTAVDAPLYPIEEFSDHLTQMIGYIGELDELLALASRADDLVATRAGAAAAGDKAIDRAFSLLDRDESAAAIRELQKAKAKWFSGEQLGWILRILLLLAEQYGRLGLIYASKYHAMAAAYIARCEDLDRVGNMLPRALLALLDAEDAAGNSLGFLQLFPVMIVAHVQHDSRPFHMDEHPRMHENMGQLAALLGILNRSAPEARKSVDTLATNWPPEIKQPIWQAADQRSGFWSQGTWDDTWTGLEEAMLDRPFGDLGPTRRVRWKALGIELRCEFANDYAITPSAEQLIAELQLAACAMAGRDLGIVPCAITIKLTCDDEVNKLEFTVHEDDGCEIGVRLPLGVRSAHHAGESIALFAAILHCCSAHHDEALFAAFDRSVFDPIFVGRPYAELYLEFVSTELFAEEIRKTTSAFEPDRNFESSSGERVPWFDGPGSIYDHEQAQLDIAHRYNHTRASLQHTLPRLLADTEVMTHLQAMHEQGMKDWEILSILSNIAINHRIAQEGDVTMERSHQRAFELMTTSEPQEDALDPGLFGTEQLDLYAGMFHAAFLNGRQLRAPVCFSTAGLERFLVARYRLRQDDVEHDDVFGWSDARQK
ncbi:hypothetical protein VSX64_18215 [Aurantimonas sp. C2-6-R+9]|uniref:hypothetical protein n=1 Tax=unclassified Aurantimonas TaxID=2638230 RepID=UPI002E16FEDB|nr:MULTISPECIES: hypothetical protein [unclassified Aurantimonas]MEC5292549.1 hypothetical protein [Aurantimonas sp. C2-3-R2]MEC5382778.1 hypothetical protein [Aurantimonas sp. C2-6-R+9]MEC5413581.1 hypothetical protein [Aurantimonas sp. C2-4-R8]